jgi:hypothetical protein
VPNTDSRMYPTGSGAPKSRPILGTFVEFGVVKKQRTRVTLAQVNAGFTLLPALPGVRWRLTDACLISIGGAFGASTSVNLIGTRSGSAVQLLAVAIAALSQSALVRAGAANATLLADGTSFTQLDANTAVTIGKVGSTGTTATNVDVLLEYVADPA